jgi:hypothetical protein
VTWPSKGDGLAGKDVPQEMRELAGERAETGERGRSTEARAGEFVVLVPSVA